MHTPPTPKDIASALTAGEIRSRIDLIQSNLANPSPGCKGSAFKNARREANAAIGIYRSALSIIRKR
jgi:hypothetical protein